MRRRWRRPSHHALAVVTMRPATTLARRRRCSVKACGEMAEVVLDLEVSLGGPQERPSRIRAVRCYDHAVSAMTTPLSAVADGWPAGATWH